ncbi:MAG: hypothetical protein PHN45_05460 [Methylococcales bacterium]|nr:hypothetical protein [Methylococcales bacterium]MDD5754183.1 hypothetical protein [Methylococcales bacterium]
MKQPIPIQTTLLNAEIPTDSIPPLTMRVNCATLAKVLNVSRTSVKRFVDSGLIELDADRLVDVKQATHAVLTKSMHVKKRLLKSEIDEAAVLRKQIAELTTKLLDTRAKLKETQTELQKITDLYDQNGDDYFALDDAITAFIDALVNDDDLKTAVFEGNRQFMQNAFDNLLELENVI